MEFNHRITYSFDYLFGGNIAFAAQLAAKNASAITEQDTFNSVRDQLTLLSQLAALRSQAARSASNDKDNKKTKARSNDKNKSDEKNKGSKGKKYIGKNRIERFVQSHFTTISKVVDLALFIFSAYALLIISAAAITLSCNINYWKQKL